MCELCSVFPATAKKARADHEYYAEKLRELAKDYQRLASGNLAPHSEEAKITGIRARQLVRRLVEDWV